MSVLYKRVFRPLPGRERVAQIRVRRWVAALSRSGGRHRAYTVAMGDGARDIQLYSRFPDMQTGVQALATLAFDPDAVKLREEQEELPSSQEDGPEIWRSVVGENDPDHPVQFQREYSLDRRNLGRMVSMFAEIQALRPNIPMVCLTPVVSGDMGRYLAVYNLKSMDDVGEAIDNFSLSDSFQAIAARAAEFGLLTKSRVIAAL